MEHKKIESIIEAMLFAKGEPVSLKAIAKTLNLTDSKTKEIIEKTVASTRKDWSTI